jgi:amidohydrolase
MNGFHAEAEKLFSRMVDRRRDFHRHPELGFEEVRTSGIVADELRALGLDVKTGVGRTGVVGLLAGASPGPTILLRFDMDALPITETNQTDYVSQNEGVMHACGHDGHTTIGLAVARMLLPHRDKLRGTVKFVFQPAEEGLGGAQAMIDDGVMDRIGPPADRSLALHLWNTKPLGWVAATNGPAMAASARFEIRLTGYGGHAAAPQEARDPVLACAYLTTALQSIVSRNVDPLDSAVLSVTAIDAGDAFNVIPNEAVMRGTIRSFRRSVYDLVTRRLGEITDGVSRALFCSAAITINDTTPPTVNELEMAGRVRSLAKGVPGVREVVDDERTMGSEDMAYMMETVPGCYFFVGSGNAEKDLAYPHHHPRFDFDERAMVIGAALMAEAAAEYLVR